MSMKMNSKKILKITVIVYILITLFLIAFKYVINTFVSHGVSTRFMTYPFMLSLVLGVAGFIAIGRLDLDNLVAFNLYNAGIATLIVGSVMQGTFDIAGADAIYPIYYFIVGTAFVISGGAMYFYQGVQNSLKKQKRHDS